MKSLISARNKKKDKSVKDKNIPNDGRQWIELKTFYCMRIPAQSRLEHSFFMPVLSEEHCEWVYWMDDSFSVFEPKIIDDEEWYANKEAWTSRSDLLSESDDGEHWTDARTDFVDYSGDYDDFLGDEDVYGSMFSDSENDGSLQNSLDSYKGFIPEKVLSRMSVDSRKSLCVNFRGQAHGDSKKFYHIYYPMQQDNLYFL